MSIGKLTQESCRVKDNSLINSFISLFVLAPEKGPPNLIVSNITWSSFHLHWDAVEPDFVPGIIRSYHIVYRIVDPGFNQSDHSLVVDSHARFANISGLIGYTNYEVSVAGVTIKVGNVSVTHFQTESGGTVRTAFIFLGSEGLHRLAI